VEHDHEVAGARTRIEADVVVPQMTRRAGNASPTYSTAETMNRARKAPTSPRSAETFGRLTMAQKVTWDHRRQKNDRDIQFPPPA
jgi:hypothetical protein